MNAQQWTTAGQITAARRRFESAIPGWQRPVAFAVEQLTGSGIDFVKIDVGESPLPAVVLAGRVPELGHGR
ncbi:hypothetical protein [Pseudofrankia sp. BMG5.37]|uniref:hypothetical protein n=1 Tax=Pseudofrankia sp. BMG5.37 TaxID=3050035 RepID=UPI0010425387|nr:hypothetical protein [Pseudofrankia sp. BMG5.37]MDT3446806.1 hypothetical protein [Pseudofrankia sp. BMG5.37]